MRLCQCPHLRFLTELRADRQHARYARIGGACDKCLVLPFEIREIQMAMTVRDLGRVHRGPYWRARIAAAVSLILRIISRMRLEGSRFTAKP